MSRDEVLRELMERRVRREADDREAEVRSVQRMIRLESLAGAWRGAHDEATAAYELWSLTRGADGYAIYRAAQDRADEAQDALWQQHLLTHRPSGYDREVVL